MYHLLSRFGYVSFTLGYSLSSDIDTIEIRSEDEEGSGAAKQRRSYNYKVKTTKALTEILAVAIIGIIVVTIIGIIVVTIIGIIVVTIWEL